MRLGIVLSAAFIVAGTCAGAVTTTFEATIRNVTGGAELLDFLGISSGGTLAARVTYDTDTTRYGTRSCGYPCTSHFYRDTAYTDFTLKGPKRSLDAAPSDGRAPHKVNIYDSYAYDKVEVSSRANSSATDGSSYYSLVLRSSSTDAGTRILDRGSDPITDDLLNAFDQRFILEKYVLDADGRRQLQSISSSDVFWSELSDVPLPAGFGLLLSGLGALGVAGRSRKRH